MVKARNKQNIYNSFQFCIQQIAINNAFGQFIKHIEMNMAMTIIKYMYIQCIQI